MGAKKAKGAVAPKVEAPVAVAKAVEAPPPETNQTRLASIIRWLERVEGSASYTSSYNYESSRAQATREERVLVLRSAALFFGIDLIERPREPAPDPLHGTVVGLSGVPS